jgi:hypothetical protein
MPTRLTDTQIWIRERLERDDKVDGLEFHFVFTIDLLRTGEALSLNFTDPALHGFAHKHLSVGPSGFPADDYAERHYAVWFGNEPLYFRTPEQAAQCWCRATGRFAKTALRKWRDEN